MIWSVPLGCKLLSSSMHVHCMRLTLIHITACSHSGCTGISTMGSSMCQHLISVRRPAYHPLHHSPLTNATHR